MRIPILLIFLFGFSTIYDVEAYPAKHEPADNSVYGIQHCINMTEENEEKINSIVGKISEYLYNLTIEYDIFDIRLLKIVIEGHSDDEVEEKDTQIQLIVNDCAQPNESADAEESQEIIVDDSDENKETIEINFVKTDNYESDDETEPKRNATSDPSDDTANNTQNPVAQKPDTENGVNNTVEDVEDPETQNPYTENSVNNNNDEETAVNNQTSTSNLEKSEQQDNTESNNTGIDIDDIQPSSAANFEVQGPVLVRLDLDKNGKKLIQGTQVRRGKHVPLILYIQKVLGNIEYLFAN